MWPDAAVEIWLQQVASSLDDTTRPLPKAPSSPNSRKRKRALVEKDSNANTSNQPLLGAKRQKNVTQHHVFPVYAGANTEFPQNVDTGVGARASADLDRTPRPPTSLQRHPMSVGTPSFSRYLSASSSPSKSPTKSHGSYASTSTASSAAGTKRKRNAKRELLQSEFIVHQKPLDKYYDLPGSLQLLAQDMDEIAFGRGVLGNIFTGWQEQLKTGLQWRDDTILDTSNRRVLLGSDPCLDKVLELIQRARRASTKGCSEASWNSFVYSSVLRIAQDGSTYTEKVLCEDITVASIAKDSSAEFDRPSKRADFCIALELGPEWERRLRDARIDTLNHTGYLGVAHNPIAISIETKPAADAGTEATLQLQTWVQAQRRHLRSLLRKFGTPDTPLPPLPLVMVQGHSWKMFYFVENTDPSIDADHTLYHSDMTFGSTDTALGIYTLVTGLQRLMAWSEQAYRPWFMKNILEPMLTPMSQPPGSM